MTDIILSPYYSLFSQGATVAPALQAAQAELEKARLEDKLEGRLERRPDREDLERRGIVSLTPSSLIRKMQ